jgi:hypothetical protein
MTTSRPHALALALALVSCLASAGEVRPGGPRLQGGPRLDAQPIPFVTVYGQVVVLEPPDRFVLDDGLRLAVDSRTRFVGDLHSYSDIEIGSTVRVTVARTDGGNRAALISLVGDAATGDRRRVVEGEVAFVTDRVLVLTDRTAFQLRRETRFLGDAERPGDLRPGWRVRVEAIELASGALVALAVTADDRRVPTTAGHDFAPHEALLVTVEGADATLLARQLEATVVNEIPGVAVLLSWTQEIDDQLLESIARHPDVVAVEPNYTFRDPESVRRRYPIVDRTATVETFLHQAATAAISLTHGGQGSPDASVTVAVLDTGVDPTHHVLRSILLDGGLDLIDGDTEPWEHADGIDQDEDGDVDEAHGHGTFVASLVSLVAPHATILPYRVLDAEGSGSAFNVAVALADAIDRDVDVVNLSFTYRDRSEVVDVLLDKADAAGVVIVAAAGNDDDGRLPFPASDSHALAVTALTASGDALADFANASPQVLLAAPGEHVYGALPSGLLGTWEGTSFAAPLASGVAALIRLEDPGIDPSLIRQAILAGGRSLSTERWNGVILDVEGALALIE